MSKRSYHNTTPTLPEKQYEPVTNWMADLSPLTKKARAIHPRQRGNNNNNNNKQRQHQSQHKQQQRQEPQKHQQQPSKSNSGF